MSATRNSKIADVIVIGSGPTGGFAAHELARAGVKVLLIEAGQPVDLSRLDTHAYPFDKRGRKGASPFYDDSSGSVAYDTDGPAWVDRIRVLGGRSMHWNAVCLRFSADDFRERSTNGIEVDWPLSYDELAPHYTYVEKMIGVVGTKEGLAVAPDGHYIAPPPPFRCAEVLAKQACKKLGIRMIPTRKALSITASGGRGACHYCGHCMAGCHRNAIFTTPNTLLPRALRSKNLQVRTGALARELVTDRSGRVVGVVIIDRTTKQEEMLRADAFVLGCGAIETPRLLLNSRSARTPDGLGNDNGLVGRYLTGHSKGDFFAYADDLVGTAMVDNDGALDHSIIPRFTPRHPKGDYRGGFQIQTQFATTVSRTTPATYLASVLRGSARSARWHPPCCRWEASASCWPRKTTA